MRHAAPTHLGRDRHNPRGAHNPKQQERRRTCKVMWSVVRKWRHGEISAPYQVVQENDGRTGSWIWCIRVLGQCPDHWTALPTARQGDAKNNPHVHSPRKMQQLSMGTDGHTGPNAFISIICFVVRKWLYSSFLLSWNCQFNAWLKALRLLRAELLRYIYERCTCKH